MNLATQKVIQIVILIQQISYHSIIFILGKIKKRYGNLGTIVRAKINRSNNSMGLALAGHRNRSEMGCFIAGINPKGAASSQDFKVSDEILEVCSLSNIFS